MSTEAKTNIHRHSYVPRYVTYEGEFGGCIEIDDEDGEYVLFTDHISLLAASSTRVEKLEAALRTAEKELLAYIPMLHPNVRKEVAQGALRQVQSALRGKGE